MYRLPEVARDRHQALEEKVEQGFVAWARPPHARGHHSHGHRNREGVGYQAAAGAAAVGR